MNQKIAFFALFSGFILLLGFRFKSVQEISKYQYPHHVNISWATDPSTSQSVNWRTSELQKEGYVEYIEAVATPFFKEKVKSIKAESDSHPADDGLWNYHSVNIPDLKPNTMYSYRVGNGNFWSEWAEFRTATGENEKFNFLYFGDVQRDIISLGSRTIRQAVLTRPDAKFLLFGGDMVHRGGLNKENWNEFFQTGGWAFQNFPIVGTPGNHEHLIAKSGENLSAHWGLNFTFPLNGPEGHEEETFYIDYNNIRVISLNLCRYKYPEDRATILKWTEERLKEFTGDWVFITHHYAMDASARNRKPGIRFPDFKELYEKYNVPIILTGHEHLYARGRMDGKFPIYVVSVSGPFQNAIQFGDWIERAGTSLQLYQDIEVSPDKIHYVTKTVTGEIYDEFTIQKDKKGKLIFTESKNLGPESLFPPINFGNRYNQQLVDTWEKDKNDYLSKKNK
ncbi:FN3 domain-containing metallophosphoesterase family protein [Flexithrix dorotheae]|uniref:FN3 domain-containing metallophosphoesterase family protein n=1 Tax=Flexithrix dorotheae TaxID=70993 RepID=UPI000375E428|nr:FN3 domain-containing metallophosphoesterase family protein [Flexithrix dorotheae]